MNNDREVIAWYYLRSVEKVQGIYNTVYSVTYNNNIILKNHQTMAILCHSL